MNSKAVHPFYHEDLAPSPTPHRFKKALKFTLLTLLAFFVVGKGMQNFRSHGESFHPSPPPSDGEVVRCVPGDEWNVDPTRAEYDRFPVTATTSFDLDVDPESLLYFLARGPLLSGAIEVVSSPGTEVVKVDIVGHFRSHESIKDVLACQLKSGSSGTGVGIYGMLWRMPWPLPRGFYVDVRVTLPVPSDGSPLLLAGLRTDMPTFVHEIGALEESVEFRTVYMKTSNVPITVQSIRANVASFTTSNAPIEGSFNTSTLLEITTANSAIRADTSLYSGDEGCCTNLVARTSNSPINLIVGLLREDPEAYSGGKYRISATTSNSPLTIVFPTSPIDALLNLQATTSNSPVYVDLHPAYEGSFSVQSSTFKPVLEEQHVEDPSAEGRQRSIVVLDNGRYSVSGIAYWGTLDDDKVLGSVDVVNSHSPSRLRL